MSSAKYEAVAARGGGDDGDDGDHDDRHPPPAGSGSSHGSSPPTRWTPDEDSDDDLDALEAEEGMELKEWVHDTPRPDMDAAPVRDGSDGDDDGDDEEEEEEDGKHRRRRVSVASFELYTPDEERRVRRKLDSRLVLFVALLYMLSFLDRSNIGNAKVAGLTADLRLSDAQFEWLLSAFYITYILFEWMTMCYTLFPPHIYISCCVCAWGVLASLQALTSAWPPLLALRALLGVAEAAFVGMPFYLSFFFRRDELALRVGYFIAAAPLANSFASSLAWLIVRFGHRSPIASWRLLFLVEGFPACLVAVWAWWWIPDSPATARWLNRRERRVAALRMRAEEQSARAAGGTPSVSEKAAADVPRHKRALRWREIARTLRDPKSYLTAGMFFCCNVAFSSMPVFLPTILNSMGFSALQAQGMAAPPFLFAFLVVLLTARLSDRIRSRSGPMMFHAALAASGYLLAALASPLRLGPTWRYLAVYPICAGFFSAVTIVITWTVNNQPSDEGKGSAMALLNVIGQCGPLLGTRLYPDSDRPYFVTGSVVCAVAMVLVGVLALALRVVLIRENARRRGRWKQAEGRALVGGRREEEFVYMI